MHGPKTQYIYTNILKGVSKPETVPCGALPKGVLLHVIHNNKKNQKLHSIRFDPEISRTNTKVLTTRPNNIQCYHLIIIIISESIGSDRLTYCLLSDGLSPIHLLSASLLKSHSLSSFFFFFFFSGLQNHIPPLFLLYLLLKTEA